ncbi:MAG: nickel-dependent lactate racemase [Verrucomicrobiales bacterium]|nr:nickel-dependent lactate racemase [Verrucomicrobiales bacterium]
MNVRLAYGRGYLEIDLPSDRTTVIQPMHRAGLDDEKNALLEALRRPIGSAPLRSRIRHSDKICILFTDITRATPNDRLIPWILEHLADHPRENITLLNQTGTHRPNTREELERMLTPEVVRNYRVLNHECEKEADLLPVGTLHDGSKAMLNRHALEADLRLVTGFIEPHFFAGFSGGPKGLMPGVAGLHTVMTNHGYRNIGDPRATFGVTEGNPLWEELLAIALATGPSFLVNVTLNEQRQITRVFAGDLVAAHRTGIEYVRASAMQKVKAPFEVVVTTNSGYPLDLNLYQGVKGMSAGARIVAEGGTLILACECCEGVPGGSPLDQLLRSVASPEEMLTRLATPGFVRPEQWQAQIQALVQRRAQVLLHSRLPDDTVRQCHLAPCHDIAATVRAELERFGPEARVAVLPQGPLTIPYLA